MNKALGLIRLLRPINCLMTGIAVLIGETIVHKALYLYPSLLGFITAFTLTGASMVTNDYWDRSVDAINAPDRPVASGLISVRLARLYALILIAIGLSSAILTSNLSFLLAMASLLVSLLYSYKGKKLGLLGNVMVSGCIAIPLIYGSLIYISPDLDFNGLRVLFFFDIMVFLAITGREVNKGIVDLEGDRTNRVLTVAVRWGVKGAAILAVVLYLSAVALSIFPWLLKLTSWMYLPFVAVADIGFIASSFILLRDHSKESAMRVKKMVLIWMGISLFAFLAGVFG